jgi:hypothetical protein
MWSAFAMDEILSADVPTDERSIDRCLDLLGDEAVDLCDDEVDRIRRCADIMARVVIELFLEEKRPTIH